MRFGFKLVPGRPTTPFRFNAGPFRPATSLNVFVTDTFERRVGTAAYRSARRMAFRIRGVTRGRLRRKKHKPIGSEGELNRVQSQALDRLRRRWRARGGDASGIPYPEANLFSEPSKPGTTPRMGRNDKGDRVGTGLRHVKFGVFAAAAPGVTPRSTRASFLVGPRQYPQARVNRGRMPALHEQGGRGQASGFTGTAGPAKYPPRPYISPVYKQQIGRLKQFFEQAVAEDARRNSRRFLGR